jgi:transcriptional regulator with XRE-family HTH domain
LGLDEANRFGLPSFSMDHPLKTYRALRQISQVELARQLGVTSVTLSRWESGKRQPSTKAVTRIMAHTGIAPVLLRPDFAAMLKAAL